MKKQKGLPWVFILLITFLISCDKENNKPKSYLQSKSWKLAMVDKNASTNPQENVLYYAVRNCQKDDTHQFGATGSLTINQGTSKCDSNEDPTKTVPYTYDKASKELVIDGIKYTLAEESATQLKYYTLIPTTTGFTNLVYLLD